LHIRKFYQHRLLPECWNAAAGAITESTVRAGILGLKPTTLESRIKTLDIKRLLKSWADCLGHCFGRKKKGVIAIQPGSSSSSSK